MMKKILFSIVFCVISFVVFAEQTPKHVIQNRNERLWDIALKHSKENGYTDIMQYAKDIARWNDLDVANYQFEKGQELWLIDPQSIQEKSENMQGPKEETGKEEVEEDSEGYAPKQEPAPIQINEPKSIVTGGNGNGNEKPSSSISWVWLLLVLLIGSALGVFLFYLLYAKKLMSDYRYMEKELSQVKSDLTNQKTNAGSELSKLRSENQSLKQRNKDLDGENGSLREEIVQLKTTQHRVNENRKEEITPLPTNQVATQTSGQVTMLYADAIIDNYFVKVREILNEDSIFVLHLSGANSATFTIHKPAYQRIVANPSFLDGCDKQILRDTMHLEIVSEGRAQRDASNGKWKVIDKLNVIIR